MSWKDASKALDIDGVSSDWKSHTNLDGGGALSWKDAGNLSADWMSASTPLHTDLTNTSADEREAMREVKRIADEQTAHATLAEETKQWRKDEEEALRDRQIMDALEAQKMAREKESAESRVQQLGKAADTTIETYEAMVNNPTMQLKMAEFEKQLEVADEFERLHVCADAEREASREKGRRAFIMNCQANNPLGLFNVASGNAVGAEIAVPTAKQALQLSKTSEIAGIEENPPVYSEQDLFSSQTAIADPSFWPKPEDVEKGFDFARCYQCFDAIVPSVERGQSGRACRKGARLYHSECYFITGAPECTYCGVPLVRNDAKGLSGQWGIHKHAKYHIECYQLYAGPRCCVCWDVIFADPAKNISGHWLSRNADEIIHMECYNFLRERQLEERHPGGMDKSEHAAAVATATVRPSEPAADGDGLPPAYSVGAK